MCEPTTLAAITLAVSAASSVAAYSAQRQQAKAQEHAAQDAYIANQTALDVQQNQVNEQASQEMSARALEALRERGRLRTIAADMGSGNSMARLEGEVNLSTATDLATIERNREMREQQAQLEKRGMQSHAQSQVNLSKRPSAVALGLDLANSGLKSYSTYRDSINALKIV